jgi:hypothetical protein
VYTWPGITGGDNGEPWIVDEPPFFDASPSCWQNLPEPVTKIPNFFLAGSYTRGRIPAESMEGANESGRRVANGVLDASGVPAIPVDVPTFTVPSVLRVLHELDDRRYDRGLPNAFDVVARWPFRLRSRKREAGVPEVLPERLLSSPAMKTG